MFGIAVWQTILRQDSMHLYIIVALLTQNINDLTDDILRVFRRPLGNLDNSLVTCLATLQFLLRNKNIVNKDITLSNQEGVVFLHLQLTNSLVALMTKNLNNHSLLDMLLTTSHHSHLDPVAIQRKH